MSTDTDDTRLKQPVTDADHRRGPDDAPVTVVMYGDYECPDTRAAHSVIQRLRARLGDDLRVVFRHFPLTHEHPNARHAAIAAEVAADQGHFWEVHDQFMQHPVPLDDEALLDISSNYGVANDSFDDPYNSQLPLVARVDEQIQTGQRDGISETPTIFINDFRHRGAADERTLQAAIDLAR
jgi:formate-nitrite transporter family protein